MSNESQLIYSKLTSQPFDVFDERGHVVVAGPRPLRATAPALVEVDQPERALEVRARQGGEVVAAMAGPAVQEDDRRDTCRRCSRDPVPQAYAVDHDIVRAVTQSGREAVGRRGRVRSRGRVCCRLDRGLACQRQGVSSSDQREPARQPRYAARSAASAWGYESDRWCSDGTMLRHSGPRLSCGVNAGSRKIPGTLARAASAAG